MVDERVLLRVDWFLTMVSLWFVLVLVVACFALMTVDTVLGVLALATVVLTVVVAIRSYLQAAGTWEGLAVVE